MSLQQEIFNKLLIIVPDLDKRIGYGKSKLDSDCMMDLNLDILHRENNTVRIALSHYYKHPTGDMIPDPDMEIFVDFNAKSATSKTYQDIMQYQTVDLNGEVDESFEHALNEFLHQWLDNNISYGHKIGE